MPTSTSASQRIEALSNHLKASATQKQISKAMSTDRKPPITCHVLDTTIGKPAASIPVTLTYHNPTSSSASSPSLSFSATTNTDGRVTSWTPSSSAPFTSPADLETLFKQEGDQKYSLTFNTEDYFGERGVKTFFPEVEVKFVVRGEQKEEHFHVPVLLGPFGYTTYRGS
jgi:5-hydroxyisourate hydrolase